jgi:DNA-binding protein HU-alpha
MAAPRSSTKSTSTSEKKAAPKRSSTKAAARKPVAAKAPPAKDKPAATKTIKPAPRKAPPTPFTSPGEMGKKELLERVVAESGLKKGDARAAMNAMLKVLHGALSEGKDVSAARGGYSPARRSYRAR